MLTLGRFRALADSYGADLRSWPEEMRGEAELLARASAEARAVLDEAQTLDEAIAAASAHEDALLWLPGEQDAALARLRAGVGARIAASSLRRRARGLWALAGGDAWATAAQLRWLGMATGGGVAIMAGLLIGALYASAPAPDNVLTLLEPSPIHILAD
jgi:hypothetical protein